MGAHRHTNEHCFNVYALQRGPLRPERKDSQLPSPLALMSFLCCVCYWQKATETEKYRGFQHCHDDQAARDRAGKEGSIGEWTVFWAARELEHGPPGK